MKLPRIVSAVLLAASAASPALLPPATDSAPFTLLNLSARFGTAHMDVAVGDP